MLNRPDKGFETFKFCMTVFIGWRQTAETMKKKAWKEAEKIKRKIGVKND
jgi:hypothetical protein